MDCKRRTAGSVHGANLSQDRNSGRAVRNSDMVVRLSSISMLWCNSEAVAESRALH